jgi:hypothetical protein
VEVEIERDESYEILELLGYSTWKFVVDKLRGRNEETSGRDAFLNENGTKCATGDPPRTFLFQ